MINVLYTEILVSLTQVFSPKRLMILAKIQQYKHGPLGFIGCDTVLFQYLFKRTAGKVLYLYYLLLTFYTYRDIYKFSYINGSALWYLTVFSLLHAAHANR
jgi:hypothetical protein